MWLWCHGSWVTRVTFYNVDIVNKLDRCRETLHRVRKYPFIPFYKTAWFLPSQGVPYYCLKWLFEINLERVKIFLIFVKWKWLNFKWDTMWLPQILTHIIVYMHFDQKKSSNGWYSFYSIALVLVTLLPSIT